MAADPVTVVNLLLCIVILVIGIAAYAKKKDSVPLYIAIAFSLFGVSHLATILGFAQTLATALIIVRTLAYLIVIVTLFKLWRR